jgi:ATP-dependent DNA helicase RecG
LADLTQLAKRYPFAWEHGMAMSYVTGDEVLDLLDYASYFRMLTIPLPDKSAIFGYLETDQLIVKDVGGKWNITNLGAILIANDIRKFPPSLGRKAVRFVAYNGKNRVADVTHRQDGGKGYANGFEGLISFVNGLIPKNEVIEQALRRDNPMFPQLAVRELIANALIHQDMTISGTGPQIELFEDRIEFTNPGTPLVPTDRMIDLPPRSRNEALAAIMRRMGICEEQGSGLDKVISSVEVYQLPPPLFKANETSMQVVLYRPRKFADMTPNERVRACYQHSILKLITDTPMTNKSLRKRFGIEKQNAAQASKVLGKALEEGLIKYSDPDHPRSGYVPHWA